MCSTGFSMLNPQKPSASGWTHLRRSRAEASLRRKSETVCVKINAIRGTRTPGEKAVLLLDTSVLIGLEQELARREIGLIRTYLGRHKGEDLACSTVTVGELASGANETTVRVLLRHLRKLPLSEAIAYRAGELDRAQMRQGRRLGENDNWIAATALHYSSTLVYADGDFDRVGGLKREKLRHETVR